MSNDSTTEGGEPTGVLAEVIDIFAAPSLVADQAEDLDEPDLDDLAFIAKRLVISALSRVEWPDLAELAKHIVDESDVALIRQLLTKVKFSVEIPGLI